MNVIYEVILFYFCTVWFDVIFQNLVTTQLISVFRQNLNDIINNHFPPNTL